jgi:hypothetical protein
MNVILSIGNIDSLGGSYRPGVNVNARVSSLTANHHVPALALARGSTLSIHNRVNVVLDYSSQIVRRPHASPAHYLLRLFSIMAPIVKNMTLSLSLPSPPLNPHQSLF